MEVKPEDVRVTYKDVLIRALILADKLKDLDEGFVGVIALIVPIVVTPILGLLSDRKESREPVRRPT